MEVSTTRVRELSHPMLAARFGGPLSTARDRDDLVPNPAVYHVLVQIDSPLPTGQEVRGDIHIEGNRRSLLGDVLRRVVRAFVTERADSKTWRRDR